MLYRDVTPWQVTEIRPASIVRNLSERAPGSLAAKLIQVSYQQLQPVLAWRDVIKEGDSQQIAALDAGPQETITIRGTLPGHASIAAAATGTIGGGPPYVSLSLNGATYHVRVGVPVQVPAAIAELARNAGLI